MPIYELGLMQSSKKKFFKSMGLGKELACLSVFLLMLIHLQITPCFGNGRNIDIVNRFTRLLKGEPTAAAAAANSYSNSEKRVMSSTPSSVKAHCFNGGLKGKTCYKENDIFGADKRKVRTGNNSHVPCPKIFDRRSVW